MNDETTGRPQDPPAPPRELFLRDRILATQSLSFALARHRRTLLQNLRNQFDELRAQRDLLIKQRGTGPKGGPAQTDGRRTRLEEQYGLTRRESEVALLLADGCGNAAIASKLGISPHTARHHTQHVLTKLGVHSRAAAGARLRS